MEILEFLGRFLEALYKRQKLLSTEYCLQAPKPVENRHKSPPGWWIVWVKDLVKDVESQEPVNKRWFIPTVLTGKIDE